MTIQKVKLLKEVSNKKMDEEAVDMFRMERKVNKQPRTRPILVQFESQTSKNVILEEASKLKNNEVFKRIILIKIYQRRTEECKKLLLQNKKGSIQRVGQQVDNTNEGQPRFSTIS